MPDCGLFLWTLGCYCRRNFLWTELSCWNWKQKQNLKNKISWKNLFKFGWCLYRSVLKIRKASFLKSTSKFFLVKLYYKHQYISSQIFNLSIHSNRIISTNSRMLFLLHWFPGRLSLFLVSVFRGFKNKHKKQT